MRTLSLHPPHTLLLLSYPTFQRHSFHSCATFPPFPTSLTTTTTVTSRRNVRQRKYRNSCRSKSWPACARVDDSLCRVWCLPGSSKSSFSCNGSWRSRRRGYYTYMGMLLAPKPSSLMPLPVPSLHLFLSQARRAADATGSTTAGTAGDGCTCNG